MVAAAAVFATSYAALAQVPKAQPPASVRLYVFDCGRLDIPDITPYQLKREEIATNVMSVPCFLVAHPKGTLMWDVGAVPDRMIPPGGGTGTLRVYGTSTKKLETQLAEIGYAPADITFLAMSHFHWDHVGNANLFAGATWLVRPLERELMFADPPSPRTEPTNFSALKTSKTVIIRTGDYDVFGDGSVVIKSAPGHSPDHQVLYVKLAKTGGVLLSGDLYHYPEERALRRVPTTEFNGQQTATSRAAIESFLQASRAQLWIEHDFTANKMLKKAPAFYD
jgi:glyoxylase-like metal-dependent hydrolase (beta-lactamase superfamily II)